jgi:predicted cobalt transporter CbtA
MEPGGLDRVLLMTAARLWRRGWELAMADKSALGLIGLMLCTTTALVMMIGVVVVNDHLTGRLQIDDNLSVVALPSTAR